MTSAIIVAAGKSSRMGAGTDKAFLSLVNKPVVAWSLLSFEHCADIDRIVLVVRKEQLLAAKAVVKMFGIAKIQAVVAGGSKRQESVMAGLKACDENTRVVVIHDGARPCVTPEMITEVVKIAAKSGAATIGRKMIDTVKLVEKNAVIKNTVDREKLWCVQTPQAFQFNVVVEAYNKLGKVEVTDDCQAVEMAGGCVKIVESNRTNIKITMAEDLQVASALLK